MSALIFVALAGAWAVYLVPKALKQQEDADAVRSVESFSDRLRVLDPRKAVAAPAPAKVDEVAGQPATDLDEDEYVLEPVRLTKVQLRLRRAAAKKAAERRRRVLGTLLLVLLAVVVAALAGSIAKAWIVAPVVLIAAWLVACRLMVKKETAARTVMVRKRRTTLADEAIAEESASEEQAVAEAADGTEEIPAVGPASASTWEPVPVTLPTYVDKAAAARTVRTIDLDSTGVWSSGRNAGDSDLAREAEASRRTEKQAAEAAEKRRSS
ncbi:MAG TPA: hypothetical protein VN088_18745 [Nocardioides sp.]|nr:hypothetical protein [Nocardioides sp.]